MFYTLSKALLFLLKPAVWAIISLLLALRLKGYRRQRLLLVTCLIVLIFGNTVIYEHAMARLEWGPTQIEQVYDIGIVLGGYAEHNSQSNTIEFYRSADRLTAAMRLYVQNDIDKILLTSGVHEAGHPEWNEAALSRDYLIAIGVAVDDILLEEESWNTYQNAQYTAALLNEREDNPSLLLITSAYHMERAMQCFAKAGLEVTPYPVDYQSDLGEHSWSAYVVPNLQTLLDWQIIIKEQVGKVVYRLRGYT